MRCNLQTLKTDCSDPFDVVHDNYGTRHRYAKNAVDGTFFQVRALHVFSHRLTIQTRCVLR